MGMVHRHDGRPARYERNDAYFQWRHIDKIRAEFSEQDIVDALAETIEHIEAYRTQFDATHPDEVSLIEVNQRLDMSTEAAWEALSEWETLEQRAALLDAARRDDPVSGSTPRRIDA